MKTIGLGMMTASLILAVLAGCASAPNVNLDRTVATRLQRIAIIGVPEPKQLEAANLGGAASAFGLVGGLVQGANNQNRAAEFTAALKGQNYSMADSLVQAIDHALKADGYSVALEPSQKPKLAADGKSDDFSDVKVDADAILALWYGVAGYVSQPFSTHFEPWVTVNARLLDAASKKPLYAKTFIVGWKVKVKDAVVLPADPKSVFASFNDLLARRTEAAAGLTRCNEIVAETIARDLGKPPGSR